MHACGKYVKADLHGISIPQLHSPQVGLPAEPVCLQVCRIGSHQSIKYRLQLLVLLLDMLQDISKLHVGLLLLGPPSGRQLCSWRQSRMYPDITKLTGQVAEQAKGAGVNCN